MTRLEVPVHLRLRTFFFSNQNRNLVGARTIVTDMDQKPAIEVVQTIPLDFHEQCSPLWSFAILFLSHPRLPNINITQSHLKSCFSQRLTQMAITCEVSLNSVMTS